MNLMSFNPAGGGQLGGVQGSLSLLKERAGSAAPDGVVEKVASLLGDALFENSGSGANIRSANNPLLGLVADHMDQNPGEFGKPHDASGSVRGWRDELSEDNYLNGDEKKAFTKGLESFITDMLSGGSQRSASPGGNFNNAWSQPAAGATNGGGLQDLLAALLASFGEEKLDNLLQPTGVAHRDARGQKEFSNDDKDVLKEVARFMDMHPEEFGKPDGKSKDWMGELSEGDQYMSGAESVQFQKAIDMIKGEIHDSAKGNSLGGLFPDAEQNFANGGAGNTLQTDASIAAGNVLSVLTQQSVADLRG